MSVSAVKIVSWVEAYWHHVRPQMLLYLERKDVFALAAACRSLHENIKSDTTLIMNAHRDQSAVLYKLFDLRENVFLTGPGGTGKTEVLKRVYRYANRRDIRIAMTSPTGSSSLHIPGGRTIHGQFGLRCPVPSLVQLKADFEEGKRVWFSRKAFIDLDMLVVDEVSMLGNRLITTLDWMAKVARGNNKPFGGIQVLFSGDLFQLSPVGDMYCFKSPAWTACKLKTVELSIPVRQTNDLRYYNILQKIRKGTADEESFTVLKTRLNANNSLAAKSPIELISESIGMCPLTLFGKHTLVDVWNKDKFAKAGDAHAETHESVAVDIYTREEKIDGVIQKTVVSRQDIAENCAYAIETLNKRIPHTLHLKAGAQYVVTSNIALHLGIANGTIFVAKQVRPYVGELVVDGSYIKVVNDVANVDPQVANHSILSTVSTRVSIGYGYYLQRYQLPLRPGYAATIHCSQGMTFTRLAADLGNSIFAAGQAYVALSRVSTLDGLNLLNFSEKGVRANKEVLEFAMSGYSLPNTHWANQPKTAQKTVRFAMGVPDRKRKPDDAPPRAAKKRSAPVVI